MNEVIENLQDLKEKVSEYRNLNSFETVGADALLSELNLQYHRLKRDAYLESRALIYEAQTTRDRSRAKQIEGVSKLYANLYDQLADFEYILQ